MGANWGRAKKCPRRLCFFVSNTRGLFGRQTDGQTDGHIRTDGTDILPRHSPLYTCASRGKNHPILMKFCTQQQILNWMNVTWSKMKKLHWTNSEFDRVYSQNVPMHLSKRPIVKTFQLQVKTSQGAQVKSSQPLKRSIVKTSPGSARRNRSRIRRPKWLTGMRFSLPVRSL